MIKLFKYEIQRKWKMTLGALVGYFIIYYAAILKFKSAGTISLEEFPFQLVFFILLGAALVFGAMIGAVNNLRIEAKQATRDLYFSVPMSAYTKIGSKVIISTVEVISAIFISIFTAVKGIESLTGITLWKTGLKELLSQPIEQLLFSILGNLVYLILMILVVYLSFAIFRSFFSQVKFGGFITIVIYALLNYILIKGATVVVDYLNEIVLSASHLWLILGGSGIFAGLVFLLIGYLFESRVSFD